MPVELSAAYIGAIAAIIASIIGLIVAVTTAVIAKEQKVSEFRQAWIDGLRNDIAELNSINHKMMVEKAKESVSKVEDKSKAVAALNLINLHGDLKKCIALIHLRLNTKDEHAKLIESLNQLSKNLMTESTKPYEAQELLMNINLMIHKVLKAEWERVKKGEMLYKAFNTIVKVVVGSCLTAFIVLVLIGSFPHLCQ